MFEFDDNTSIDEIRDKIEQFYSKVYENDTDYWNENKERIVEIRLRMVLRDRKLSPEEKENLKKQEDEIERIRQSNNIINVIKNKRCYKCGSVKHFKVSEKKQMYYCFNCGVGGNVYTYLMDKYSINFLEAVDFLKNNDNQEIITVIQ